MTGAPLVYGGGGGPTLPAIRLAKGTGGGGGSLIFGRVSGNLTGNIDMSGAASILDLVVTGSIGTNPATGTAIVPTITINSGAPGVHAGIHELTARSIYATFNYGTFMSSIRTVGGSVTATDQTPGDLAGSLTGGQFVSAGAANPGLRVAGQMRAAVLTTDTILTPIIIGNGTASGSSILIEGDTSSNAFASGTIAITGAHAGSLELRPAAGRIGSLARTLTVGSVGSGGVIKIGDGATAAITCTGNMQGQIQIGGSLSANMTIGNLPGQVSIGRNSPYTSNWSGTTVIDSRAALASLPNYRLASMFYGGGAIGLVPYRLYNDDCMPPNPTAPITIVGVTRDQFARIVPTKMAWYGPVTTSSSPVRNAFIIQDENNVTVTSQFDFALGADPRTVEILGNSTLPTHTTTKIYTVTPNSTNLRSNIGLGASNPATATFSYKFGVGPNCINPNADFNDDGFVDPDDLSDFITCFFLHVQFSTPCPAADFNLDFAVDPDDLSDFITTFFCNGM